MAGTIGNNFLQELLEIYRENGFVPMVSLEITIRKGSTGKVTGIYNIRIFPFPTNYQATGSAKIDENNKSNKWYKRISEKINKVKDRITYILGFPKRWYTRKKVLEALSEL